MKNYIEINLDLMKKNIEFLTTIVDKEKMICVVKANAYGHGIKEISRFLIKNGIKTLGVARVSEAVEIKKYLNEYELGSDYNILIMGYTPNEELKLYSNENFTFTIFELEQARILNQSKNKVHIKIDTGFNRLGKKPSEEFLEEILAINNLENISVEACFSHLRLTTKEQDLEQITLFEDFVHKLKEHIPMLKTHINDSIGMLKYPFANYDYVRLGAVIYGLYPQYQSDKLNVSQIISLNSYISRISSIKAGEGIGYDMKNSEQDRVIATIPVGYGDGYKRNLGESGSVFINGVKCRIASVICMDQLIVDITNCECNVGDSVELIGEIITVQELADNACTNRNDITTSLLDRIVRKFKETNND